MIIRLLVIAAVMFLPLLAGNASPEEKEFDIPGVGKGVELTTKHFTIRTNLEKADRDAVAAIAEETYEKFVALFAFAKKIEEPKTPFIVNVVKTKDEFQRLLKERVGAAMGSYAGLYNRKIKESFFYHEVGSGAGQVFGAGLIVHEVTHQLEHNLLGVTDKQYDQKTNISGNWLTEGLAVYFEIFAVKTSDEAGFKKRRDGFFKAVGGYSPPSQFCDYEYQQWMRVLYMQSITTAYGESGALFHYMMHADGGKYAERFVKEAVLTSKGNSKTLTAILGKPVTEIDGSFKDYAKTIFSEEKK